MRAKEDRIMSIPEILLEETKRAALVVFERRALRLGTIVTVCTGCRAFLDERAGDGVGMVEESYCEKCMPTIQ